MTLRQIGGCLALVMTLAALIAAPSAQRAVDNDKQFQAALHKEMVEGDLKSAIEEYRKISARAGVSRDVAATALVHMAECYQKLGDAQARTIYERIVRDYSDQADVVAVARTRLGGTEHAALSEGITHQKVVWPSGEDVNTEGMISQDGRYLSYSDGKTGDLAIRDLVAGTSRRLTAAPGDFTSWAEFSAISRDGRQVAFAWFNDPTQLYQLRILPIGATRQTAPRVMPPNPEMKDVYPYDWSPDGRWIAVRVGRPDRTAQIGLVSSADLSLTVLKSVDWRGPTKMFFSPDGRYLAYDLTVGDATFQRDVFVMDIDGRRETEVAAHPGYDVVMGWSPDGRSLLFASNRSGAMGLWSLAMNAGKPSGTPILIQPDLGPIVASLGVTAAGTLAIGLQTGGPNIFTAAIDPTTGKLVSEPKPVVDGYLQANRQPAWSSDGKSIVYLSNRALGPSHLINGTPYLVMQSLESGRTSEQKPLLSWFLNPHWAPDGSITVGGSDLKGRRGIFRIDPASGAVAEIVSPRPGACTTGYSWAQNGLRIAYRLGCDATHIIIVRDMKSGDEHEIARGRDLAGPVLSPDGRELAYITRDASQKIETILVVPVDGGIPREVFHAAGSTVLGDAIRWMPDGRRIIINMSDRAAMMAGQTQEIRPWMVSVDTGQAFELDRRITSSVAIHPDGRTIAFSKGEATREVRSVDVGSTTVPKK